MTTTYTAVQQAFIDKTIARMKSEILEDVRSGLIPAGVKSFGELHDHVDANEYGGLCEDSTETELNGLDLINKLFPDAEGTNNGTYNSEAGMDACNHMQNVVHEWIASGEMRKQHKAAKTCRA